MLEPPSHPTKVTMTTKGNANDHHRSENDKHMSHCPHHHRSLGFEIWHDTRHSTWASKPCMLCQNPCTSASPSHPTKVIMTTETQITTIDVKMRRLCPVAPITTKSLGFGIWHDTRHSTWASKPYMHVCNVKIHKSPNKGDNDKGNTNDHHRSENDKTLTRCSPHHH